MARPMAASSRTEPSDRPYQAFCRIDHSAMLLWIADVAAGRGVRDRGRLVPGEPGQQRQRFLVAARLDGGDGFQLLGIGGVRLEQQDRRARFGECRLGAVVVLLLQRGVDRRQHGLVMGLEHRLRGLDSLGRIRRLQRQRAERRLDVAPQFIVETHRGGAVRNAGDGRAGRRVDDLAVGLRDDRLSWYRDRPSTGHPGAR